MEVTIIEGLRVLKVDLAFTLTLAALFLFIGYALQQRVPVLTRSSIPAPAMGGLLFALIVLALRACCAHGVMIDSSLRPLLQTIFFTTIGLSATVHCYAQADAHGILLVIASVAAIAQNIVGIGVARVVARPLRSASSAAR